MANVSCFYATPIQAERLGRTISREEVVSNSDAIKLRDAYAKIAKDQSFFIGVAATVLGAGIASTAVAIGFGISATAATTYGKTYMGQLSDIYDSIATSGKNFNYVKLVYEYRRKGSNDGAYWLVDVKFQR